MMATLSKSPYPQNAEWRFSKPLVPYEEAIRALDERVQAVLEGQAPELVWLLEHPPVYTLGTSARADEVLDTQRIPVFPSGRGGKVTYHGPGQRVVYVVSDLRARGRDVRAHVARLESWIIGVLQDFGIQGERREGRVGIWVVRKDGREEKVAAIGVRVKKWIAYHGFALNVHPDLEAFKGIVPCGLPEFGVTSLAALGVMATMDDVDHAFKRRWETVFGS